MKKGNPAQEMVKKAISMLSGEEPPHKGKDDEAPTYYLSIYSKEVGGVKKYFPKLYLDRSKVVIEKGLEPVAHYKDVPLRQTDDILQIVQNHQGPSDKLLERIHKYINPKKHKYELEKAA
jgi:hypothetical protein